MLIVPLSIVLKEKYLWWWLMVFNATFNNISVISWLSVLLVEETGVPGENRRPVRKSLTNFITQCCMEYTLSWTRFEPKTLVLIGTDCTGSCKSNYHTITTTTTAKEGYLCNSHWDSSFASASHWFIFLVTRDIVY